MDSGPNEGNHEENKLRTKPRIKKVVSEQTISDPTMI